MGLCFNYQFIWVTEFAIDVAQSVEYLSSQRFCKLSFFVLNFPFMHAIGVIIALPLLHLHCSLPSILADRFLFFSIFCTPRETSSTWIMSIDFGFECQIYCYNLDNSNAIYTYSNFHIF